MAAFSKERSYSDRAGRSLVLRSERDVAPDGRWVIGLRLYEKRLFGKRLIDSRDFKKSKQWPSSAIGLLQAQEELDLLRDAGVEIELTSLI